MEIVVKTEYILINYLEVIWRHRQSPDKTYFESLQMFPVSVIHNTAGGIRHKYQISHYITCDT